MKLDKAAAIAQLNQALGMSVLYSGNTLLARFNKSKNAWWFDIPLSQLKTGKFLNLLLLSPAGDAVEHLKVPTSFLRQQQEGLELRDKNARRPTLSLELSADAGRRLRDIRPGGTGLDFAAFLQS
ncbi:hypothetical protein [Pseudomonas paraeruginosa]|uniref:hypothetical protein n=1 Tax=Pseudomonas paraeruginosa TaxID=2994495 RepID=UPI0039FD1E1C